MNAWKAHFTSEPGSPMAARPGACRQRLPEVEPSASYRHITLPAAFELSMISSPSTLLRSSSLGPQQPGQGTAHLLAEIEKHSGELASLAARAASELNDELDLGSASNDSLATMPASVRTAFVQCINETRVRKIIFPPGCQAVPGWLGEIKQLQTVVMPQFVAGDGWDWRHLNVLGGKVDLVLKDAQFDGKRQKRIDDNIIITRVHLDKGRLEGVDASCVIVRRSNWQDVTMTLAGESRQPDHDALEELLEFWAEENPYVLTFEKCSLSALSVGDAKKLKLVIQGGQVAGLDLSEAGRLLLKLTDSRIDGLDLRAAAVNDMSISRCTVDWADFSGARFRHIEIDESSLQSSRWEGALIGSPSGIRLEDDSNEQSRARGLTLRAVDLEKAAMRQVRAEECEFDADCNFREVDFDGATFVHAVMPGVDLSKTKAMNRATLKDCVFSSTTGLPEGFQALLAAGRASDIVERNSVVLASDHSLGFGNAMKKLAEKHRFLVIDDRHPWPRDNFSKQDVGSGHPLDVRISSGELKIGPLQQVRMAHKFAFGLPPKGTEYGSEEQWRVIAPAVGVAPMAGNMIITASGCCIIGNNEILHADPRHGAPVAPMGLLDEAARQKVIESFPGVTDLDLAAFAWQQRKAAKREARKKLGAAMVVILPQYLFHIDLQIAYLGGDLILVHSFEETLKLLKTDGAAYADIHGQDALDKLKAGTLELANRYELSVVQETIKRLEEKAGLRAIKCCGALMTIAQGKSAPDFVASHFMNGVTIKDEHGKMLFVTADADGVDFHKAYFTGLCTQLEVGVEFIRCNDVRHNPAAVMQGKHGGVRCRTYNSTLAAFSRAADPQ